MKLPINYEKSHWTVRKAAREQYVIEQGGLCCYCNRPLNGKPSLDVLSKPVRKTLFPKNFFNWPAHLHHCHKTGMSIGAVHAYCNAVLWQYEGE